ncbi:MAG: hypothetical protein M1818_000812 [Claussenomyces sp. TS43310]|nr:MAG: hypothetical protein M1818_000812 [Claussenomyces sp. TS43310]
MSIMVDATRYLMATSSEEEAAIADEAANAMKVGTLKLVEVVRSIGPYVTCDDLTQQAKAIQYLSAVLAQLESSALMGHDSMQIKFVRRFRLLNITVTLLIKFLTSRLEIPNVAGVRETAHGLRILSKMTRFKSTEAMAIMEVTFRNAFDFASQVASTRLEVYRLIDEFITNHRQALRTMSSTFVNGLVSLSARETDPRNLMICFSILRIILVEFEYDERQTTSLWDSVSRYFPITFRPKPNDPIGITADDLKIRLRSCISASSAFAPLAFPFLIQKLDDQTIANVKKDVMRTMTACATLYDPSTVALWSFQIWEALKYEVLNATDDDLAWEALETLQAVVSRLSFQLTLQTLEDTPLDRYVTLIVTDCNGNLREPQQRYAKQSGQILAKIAASSPLAFHLIIKGVLPPLQTIYQDVNALAKKRDLLEVVNGLLDARLGLSQKHGLGDSRSFAANDDIEGVSPQETLTSGGLHQFRDPLLEMFTIALTNTVSQEVSLRIVALQGLLKLALVPEYLTIPEIGHVVQNLNRLVIDQKRPDDQLRSPAIEALQQIASTHPQTVGDITFPALLGTLPDTLPDADNEVPLSILEAFGKIASGGVLFETFSRRLLNRLDAAIYGSSNLHYAKTILIGLLYGIQQRELFKSRRASHDSSSGASNAGDHDIELYRRLVETLYRKVTMLDVASQGDNGVIEYIGLRPLHTDGGLYPDDDMLELIGRIAMLAIRSMSPKEQLWVVPQVFKLFTAIGPQRGTDPKTSGKVKVDDCEDILFLKGVAKQHAEDVEVPKAMPAHMSVSILSMYLLAGLHKEHELPFSPRETCLANAACLIHFSSTSVTARHAMQNYVALLVNKHNATVPGTSSPEQMMPQEYIISTISNILEDDKPAKSVQLQNKLQLIFTFTMAANLKGDRITSRLLDSLIQSLEHPDLGSRFASHFERLLAPSLIITESNHALIRRLNKQRLFSTCVPRIVQLFKTSANAKIKSNCLVALAGILKHIPSDIVLPHIESLLPLLLQTLKLKELGRDGNSVKSASIEVLRIAINQSSSAAEEHIQSVISALTKTWFNSLEKPSTSSADLRANALQCMAAIPRPLRDIITLPYKVSVLRDLEEGAVGDPKRRVRTEAVDCRAAWSNLAELAGDDI